MPKHALLRPARRYILVPCNFFFVPIVVFVAAVFLRKCTHHLHSARRIIILWGGRGIQYRRDAQVRGGRVYKLHGWQGGAVLVCGQQHCTHGAAAVLSCWGCRGAILYCVLASQQASFVVGCDRSSLCGSRAHHFISCAGQNQNSMWPAPVSSR
jgi:hypothetical protein